MYWKQSYADYQLSLLENAKFEHYDLRWIKKNKTHAVGGFDWIKFLINSHISVN